MRGTNKNELIFSHQVQYNNFFPRRDFLHVQISLSARYLKTVYLHFKTYKKETFRKTFAEEKVLFAAKKFLSIIRNVITLICIEFFSVVY